MQNIQASYHDNGDIPPPVLEPSQRFVGLEESEFVDDLYGSNKTPTESTLRQRKLADNDETSKTDSGVAVSENAPKNKIPHKRETYAAIVELLSYCAFLIIVTFISFSLASPSMYYMTKVMNDLFVNNAVGNLRAFSDMTTLDDVWTFFDNQFLDGLYWNQSQIGKAMPGDNLIYYQNRLLGRPRLRMLKVRNDSCDVVKSFEREIKECFGPYSLKSEDSDAFGPGGEGFTHVDEKTLQAGHYWAKVSKYGGGGFVQLLSGENRNDTYVDLHRLKDNRWVDRGTRVVFVDFSLYNANLNLFCAVKLVVEMPATGGVMPQYSINTLKVLRYVSSYDYFVLACEALFCAFTIFYIVQNVIELCRWRLTYLLKFWNFFDLVVIAVSIAAIVFNFKKVFLVNRKIAFLASITQDFVEMNEVVHYHAVCNDITAVLVLLVWLKLFKYVTFNKTMDQLATTLYRSAKDVGAFAIMFLIFFFAYVQFGYLAFGTQVGDYSSFNGACYALLRTILGDFDFNSLERANRILGPMFFISYVFFVFFVLLNMFLAIINDAYIEVKKELAQSTKEFEVAQYVQSSFNLFLQKIGLGRKTEPMKEKDNASWLQKFRSIGYSDEQIYSAFAKCNLEPGNNLKTLEERKLVEDELFNQCPLALPGKQGLTEHQIGRISKRIDHLEETLLDVSANIRAISSHIGELDDQHLVSNFDHYFPSVMDKKSD